MSYQSRFEREREKERERERDLDLLGEVPLIPFLHVSVDLLFPFFNREPSNFVSRFFKCGDVRSKRSSSTRPHQLLLLLLLVLIESLNPHTINKQNKCLQI
eukprot:TRINITY_DN21600_c0_g1_i5.p1 TRINITY_DN21600_c0_g1~~TRINITY_DN21600_c0_g1_i5.p1  ORF type:complete len:101 (+),score=27.34 TRINITY_DN21600_c0_g1_i5:276-578(+)